jgi:hypothetical protein
MSVTAEEMMRQIIAYGMEEMRNRGLEEAVMLVQRRVAPVLAIQLIDDIGALKRDPAAKLTEWWPRHSEEPPT